MATKLKKVGVKEIDFGNYIPLESYEEAVKVVDFEQVVLNKAIKTYVDLAMTDVVEDDKIKAIQFLSTQIHACVDKINVPFRVDGNAVKDELLRYCKEAISSTRALRNISAPVI